MVRNIHELFDFQEECLNYLLDKTIDKNSKQTITIKSPTGSGKTVILLNYIDRYLEISTEEICFVWLCPGDGELEEQSKQKMDKLFPNRNSGTVDSVILDGFKTGITTFINWQKVTKKGNRAITESERKNLFDRIAEAHRNGISFIVIVDEEHMNKTLKANDIINAFSPKKIIRVSATTKKDKISEWYEISEFDVINSGLITKAMYINKNLENIPETLDMSNEYDYLINVADLKRKEIEQEYKKIGKNINPLVIIQFPNTSNELLDNVEQKLSDMGYTTENKMVSVWLDRRKTNLENLTINSGEPIFLMMKQAISTGWDCPRAKILVKLRENMSETFEIQTIGRLRRMPEIVHYDNDVLDHCYLYTFDEKYKEAVLNNSDRNLETKTIFLKQKCRNFMLKKEVKNNEYCGLGERETLVKIYDFLLKKYKLTSNHDENKKILNEQYGFKIGTTLSENLKYGRFVRIEDVFNDEVGDVKKVEFEVNTHANGIDLLHSIDVLKNEIGTTSKKTNLILRHLFFNKTKSKNKILNLEIKEFYAFIINNYKLLRDDFKELSSIINKQLSLELKGIKLSDFKIPLEDKFTYKTIDSKFISILESNSYENYTSDVLTEETRSKCERLFEMYCEKNMNIDWVYKNGDKGNQYFSIVYFNGIDKQGLFYPDYILKLKNGDVFILEAKAPNDQNIDKQAENKFEYLKEYGLKHSLKWGFISYQNENLYFNNKKYSDINAENWCKLEDIF